MNSPVMVYIILGVAVAYGSVRLEQKVGPPIAHATVWTVKEPAKGAIWAVKQPVALWFRIFPKR